MKAFISRAFVLGLIALAVAGNGAGWLLCLLLAAYGLNYLRRPGSPPTSHGSAALAGMADIKASGFCEGGGIVLGRVGGRLLTMPRWACHYLCCGTTGSGKGVSVIVPTLLRYLGPVIVLDLKSAELVALTAAHRQAMGAQVLCIDPFAVLPSSAPPPVRFNPLSILDPNARSVVDDARALAVAIVVKQPNESQPYFADMATLVLHLLILYVVTCVKPEDRHLGTAVAMARHPTAFAGVLAAASESTAAEGALAELAGAVGHLGRDREYHSVMSTLMTHLAAFDSEQVRESMAETDFDLSDLRRDATLYLCFDAAKLSSHHAVVRLWLSALLQHLIAHPGRNVLVIADEIGAIGGHIPALESAVTLLRSAGVRLALFVQSLNQLARLFPADGGQTVLANCDVQQYFGVNDIATANQISERMGAATIGIESFQRGGSYGETAGKFGSLSDSSNSGNNWGSTLSPHERRLYRPEEIMLLNGQSLILARGRKPMLTRLIRYYDDPDFSPGAIPRRTHTARVVAVTLALAAVLLLWFLQATPVNLPAPQFGAPAEVPSWPS